MHAWLCFSEVFLVCPHLHLCSFCTDDPTLKSVSLFSPWLNSRYSTSSRFFSFYLYSYLLFSNLYSNQDVTLGACYPQAWWDLLLLRCHKLEEWDNYHLRPPWGCLLHLGDSLVTWCRHNSQWVTELWFNVIHVLCYLVIHVDTILFAKLVVVCRCTSYTARCDVHIYSN